MNDRTVSAVRRLKQSADFKVYLEYLAYTLDTHNKALISSREDIQIYRSQGVVQLLTKHLETIDES